jgi:hypothetical protein
LTVSKNCLATRGEGIREILKWSPAPAEAVQSIKVNPAAAQVVTIRRVLIMVPLLYSYSLALHTGGYRFTGLNIWRTRAVFKKSEFFRDE